MSAVASTRALSLFAVVSAMSIASVQAQPAVARPASAASAPQTFAHGLFSNVQLMRPAGTPRQFVMLVSGDDAPNAVERQMAQKMVASGAMVALVPIVPFYKRLEAQDGSRCTFAAGAFENLSRHIQASERLPSYLLPMVAGQGANAAFAYALLAQGPPGTFASALSVGFCPRLVLRTPMCAALALRWQASSIDGGVDLQPASALAAPWTALQGGPSAACQPATAQGFVQRVPRATWIPSTEPGESLSASFDTAYSALAVPQVPLGPPPEQLADLPLVEMPAVDKSPGGTDRRFAVLLSGDGGWANIDKGISAALVARGVPVAGFDSLRYFWSARTPEGLAADLDRLVRYYAARWKRSEVILIGYSQGADVLPFAINRLPTGTRSRVRLTALIGLGRNASFEFHLSNWIGPSGDKPIEPEARKLSAATTVCFHGTDERDSLCPILAPANVRAVAFAGGHHLGGDYDAVAVRILESAAK